MVDGNDFLGYIFILFLSVSYDGTFLFKRKVWLIHDYTFAFLSKIPVASRKSRFAGSRESGPSGLAKKVASKDAYPTRDNRKSAKV